AQLRERLPAHEPDRPAALPPGGSRDEPQVDVRRDEPRRRDDRAVDRPARPRGRGLQLRRQARPDEPRGRRDDLRRARQAHRVPEGLAVALAKPFDLLARGLGRDLPITSARIRKLSSAETMFAADRVRATGFEPGIELRQALAQMVDWYRAEGREATPVVHIP